jgi:hypothetical protein
MLRREQRRRGEVRLVRLVRPARLTRIQVRPVAAGIIQVPRRLT